MKMNLNLALWVLGLFVILAGFALNDSISVFGSMIMIFVGLCLLPPLRSKFNDFLNPKYIEFNNWYKEKFLIKIFDKIKTIGIDIESLYDRFINNSYGFVKFIVLFSLFVYASSTSPIGESSNNDTQIATSSTTVNSPTSNENTRKIENALNVDSSKASQIYKILSACGVKDITYIEKMDGNDVRGYFVYISNANNPVRLGILSDDNVDMVIYDTWVLYEEGTQKDNLNNYAISKDDMNTLRLASMQNIRKYLTYPETAKFNSDWTGTKLDNKFILSSKVEYKNDFNQQLESPFTVQFKKESSTFKIVSLSIDNESLIKEETPKKQLSKKDQEDVKELERLMGI